MDNKATPGTLALYTAIFGPYDVLKQQPVLPGVDYLCFTDQAVESTQYRIIPCPPLHEDPVRASRYLKLLPHLYLREYAHSIWHDASIQFADGRIIRQLEAGLGEHPLLLFHHPHRDCIYAEAEWCQAHEKDRAEIIASTVAALRQQRYPAQNGLAACGLIARRHADPAIVAFSNDWWSFYQRHSRRDQLSFNFIAWQRGFPFYAFPFDIYDNPFLEVLPHGAGLVPQSPDD